ncbi:MAG: metallophosphoesterase [Lachnospiraceae bacterium]
MGIGLFFSSFALSFLGGVAFCDTHSFGVKKYTLEQEKITGSFRMVVLSDLHGKDFGKGNNKLIETVKKQKPDLIVIAGDMITAKIRLIIEPALHLVAELAKICPVYYGMGNHESYLGYDSGEFDVSLQQLKWKLELAGAHVLDDRTVYLKSYNIALSGLSLERYYYRKSIPPKFFYNGEYKHQLAVSHISKKVGEANPDVCRILIAHNPEYFPAYAKWGADVTLSGHLHGGVMRLPNGEGVISPRFQLFPEYAGGIYHRWVRGKEKTMVVSRGLGSHTISLRVFNPGEIVVLDFKKSKNENNDFVSRQGDAGDKYGSGSKIGTL